MAKLSLSIGHLSFVREITFQARSKWYDIGLNLGLPVGTLDVIAQKNGDATDHHLDMLKHWLKGTGSEPTGEALVEALKSPSVGEPQLALEVGRRLLELQRQGPLSEGAFSLLNNKCKWVTVLLAIVNLLLMVVFLLYAHNYLHLVSSALSHLMENQLPCSKGLPHPIHTFVGREADMETILQQLDFTVPSSRIVSIVGPPGFGKSTLAIHIGHHMVAERVCVYYVDMREVHSMQSLAEKIVDNGTNTTVNGLYKWARELEQKTLLILDGCDDMLQNETNYFELQNVTVKLLEQSLKLKVLITSRSRITQLNQFIHPLHNLSTEASCELLHDITSYHGTIATSLDSHTCESIANMVGNVPLALQVVGALLNQPDSPEPMRIVAKLQENLMSTLSHEKFPVNIRVNASIHLSYFHLTSRLQEIGRHLANFPGSFSEEAVCEILQIVVSNLITCDNTYGFLNNLVDRSLLEYNQHVNRYQLHRLIQEFLLHIQLSPTGNTERQKFRMAFILHYSPRLLSHSFNHSEQTILSFGTERHNYLQLFRLLEFPYNFPCKENYDVMLYSISRIALALNKIFLDFPFTPEELYIALQYYTTYIAQNWGGLHEIFPDDHVIFYLHTYSPVKLANLRARLKTNSSKQRNNMLEEMDTYSIKKKCSEEGIFSPHSESTVTLFKSMRKYCMNNQSSVNCIKMNLILILCREYCHSILYHDLSLNQSQNTNGMYRWVSFLNCLDHQQPRASHVLLLTALMDTSAVFVSYNMAIYNAFQSKELQLGSWVHTFAIYQATSLIGLLGLSSFLSWILQVTFWTFYYYYSPPLNANGELSSFLYVLPVTFWTFCYLLSFNGQPLHLVTFYIVCYYLFFNGKLPSFLHWVLLVIFWTFCYLLSLYGKLPSHHWILLVTVCYFPPLNKFLLFFWAPTLTVMTHYCISVLNEESPSLLQLVLLVTAVAFYYCLTLNGEFPSFLHLVLLVTSVTVCCFVSFNGNFLHWVLMVIFTIFYYFLLLNGKFPPFLHLIVLVTFTTLYYRSSLYMESPSFLHWVLQVTFTTFYDFLVPNRRESPIYHHRTIIIIVIVTVQYLLPILVGSFVVYYTNDCYTFTHSYLESLIRAAYRKCHNII